LTMEYFLVQGGGGTGKSFTIKRAISAIDPNSIIAAAPSHSAKNVLKGFLGSSYRVTTIAALLGKKITFNDSGEQILVKIRGMVPPILKYNVILLDEGSMVDDNTAAEILSYVKEGFKRLIILGDYCQLPPVKQVTDSIFFERVSSELTIPMRFTGPIYDLTDLVRKEIIKTRKGLIPSLNILNLSTDRVSKINEAGSGYIFLNSLNTLLKAAIRRFKKGNDSQYIRVLAYRNKTIDRINEKIRVGLYGEDPIQFEHGEQLINNGGYSIKKGRKVKTLIDNGELFIIDKAVKTIGPYNIPCMKLYFKNVVFTEDIITVASEGLEKYNKKIKDLSSAAKNRPFLWKDFYIFKESFAYFNYSYTTSIHKAQGSTIKHVFIIEDDVYNTRTTTAKEKLQSMYVAISRASFRTYIYNKGFDVDNTKLLKGDLLKDYDHKDDE